MSDDLVIGGGGSIAVATATLFSQVQGLERLRDELGVCARLLAAVDRLVGGPLLVAADAPISAVRAEGAIDTAMVLLDGAAVRAGQLAFALRLSADAYGAVESVAEGLSRRLAAEIGVGVGFIGPLAALLAAPSAVAALIGGATAVALAEAVNPGGTRRAIGEWLDGNRWLLSDPRVVELVRLTVMSLDEVGAGFAKLPPPIIRALGDDGLGLFGLDTSAAMLVAVGGAIGLLRETPVVARVASTGPTPPATGYADRAARIPSGNSQVRIDRYSREGLPDRFEVYLGGTIDPSPIATDEPFDMTSNVTALAGREAGSYRAVQDALALAGVDENSELLVTGYSQGGLIGSMLAASGDYDVRGLYTLGAPAGQVPVPTSVTWVAIEHTDDLVPAVGGTWGSADPVLVRREALQGPAVQDVPLPAHELSRYRETAGLVDAAGESRLVGANNGFTAFGSGATRVESTWYEVRRAP